MDKPKSIKARQDIIETILFLKERGRPEDWLIIEALQWVLESEPNE